MRDEVDMFINIGTDAGDHFPIPAVQHLKKHPWVTIDPSVCMASEIADLHIPVCICGVDTGGIVYRMDNVPIQFRQVLDPQGLLTDEELLNKIADRVDELTAQGA